MFSKIYEIIKQQLGENFNDFYNFIFAIYNDIRKMSYKSEEEFYNNIDYLMEKHKNLHNYNLSTDYINYLKYIIFDSLLLTNEIFDMMQDLPTSNYINLSESSNTNIFLKIETLENSVVSQLKLDQFEKYLKMGIPIGTIFDSVLENPVFYCNEPLASQILAEPESYKEMFDSFGLKTGYFRHLRGTFILKKLFEFGIPENFIIRYIVYPKSYQFRTLMPFLADIQPDEQFLSIKYGSGPIIEPFLGITDVVRSGNFALPVVRYAISSEGGTEFREAVKDICGMFYYPESESEIILNFNSALIVPNKIVAYSLLFDTTIKDIAPEFIKIDDYSYSEEPIKFKDQCGFSDYNVPYDDEDINIVYEMIKNFDLDVENIKAMLSEIFSVSMYFNELIKIEIEDNQNSSKNISYKSISESPLDIIYKYRGKNQDKDFILFLLSYTKYQCLKAMLNGTWNWRVSLFGPHTVYDQILCNKIRELNIDIAVFTTENSTGMFNIKSEIMDVRDRNVSYDNLRIRNDSILFQRREYEKQEFMKALRSKE